MRISAGVLRTVAGFIMLAAAAGTAQAFDNPIYEQTPTGNDMLHYYPDKAMNLGVEGRAVLDCIVQADRTVGSCAIVSEDPGGYEFGAAARRLSRLFKVKAAPDGPAAHIRIPINFRLAR